MATSRLDPSEEPWYHGRISRIEAEEFLENKGMMDGLFLVRDSLATTGEFALTVANNGRAFHYRIARQGDGSLAIEDGKRFSGPVELVQYHMTKLDGLLTTLRTPCSRALGVEPRGFRFVSAKEMKEATRQAALLLGYQDHQINDALVHRRSAFEQLIGGILHQKQEWFHGALDRDESIQRLETYSRLGGHDGNNDNGLFLVRERVQANSFALCVLFHMTVYHYKLDMNKLGQLSIENGQRFENLLQVVDHYSRTADGLLCKLEDPCPVSYFRDNEKKNTLSAVRHGPQRINPVEVTITGQLGAGLFGKVLEGMYRPRNGGNEIPCALKKLKTDEAANQKSEILREADAMAALEHPNIVRLIGICVDDPIMLVMELARLGPLNKYLRSHASSVSIATVTMYMYQVSDGMAYLEQMRFVHRDLAARNVLVVNESSVKISDFGMSRALGMGSNYYTAAAAGRWPLKWYAPECIYFSRFDSKSDVWSYGVTLWEALSYGAKPYQNMQGQEILKMIEGGQRMNAPKDCPSELYDVMLLCWNYRSDDRPSFKKLAEVMKKLSQELQSQQPAMRQTSSSYNLSQSPVHRPHMLPPTSRRHNATSPDPIRPLPRSPFQSHVPIN